MNASVVPRYMLGSRSAIMQVAASRWSLVIGAIFVLSAGLAREYDGEDLVHEPWHAFRPLAASLASGTALFLVVHIAALSKAHTAEGARPGLFEAWARFLGLFWFTAPMALLYAVPYERFMSPVDAIAVNLWTLAIVAAWRVILITRVIQVVYGIGPVSSFFLVMLFADAVVFTVVTLVPTPVIDVMGGIRHSDRDALIAGVTFTVMFLAVLSAPVWILGALIAVGVLRPKWPDFAASVVPAPSRGLCIVSAASVAAFVPLLFLSQPEQINRREAEALLTRGEVSEALRVISQRSKDAYPPHWNPPPKIGYRESSPDLNQIRDAMADEWPAEWIAAIYVDKIDRSLRRELLPYWSAASWPEIVERLDQSGEFYDTDPEHGITARFLLQHATGLSEPDRASLQRIAQLASIDDFDQMPEPLRAARLVSAIRHDDLQTVRAILDTGLDPDSQSPGLRSPTPLVAAVLANHAEAAGLLLDAGASIDKRYGTDLVSPAHAAAFYGSTETLELLLARGADPYVGSDVFGSLIYAAAFENHEETVRMLLAADLGIDLQAGRASDGATPLHFAYWNNNESLATLLLDAGADPDATTTDGRTPRAYRR